MPAIVSSTPRIVAPVVPSPSATSDSRPSPSRPPWPVPSVSISPVSATARPSRNGPDVDQLALRHHQRAERHEHERRDVRGSADACLDEVADRPAAEAEPEHGREEDADRRRARARSAPDSGARGRAGARLLARRAAS